MWYVTLSTFKNMWHLIWCCKFFYLNKSFHHLWSFFSSTLCFSPYTLKSREMLRFIFTQPKLVEVQNMFNPRCGPQVAQVVKSFSTTELCVRTDRCGHWIRNAYCSCLRWLLLHRRPCPLHHLTVLEVSAELQWSEWWLSWKVRRNWFFPPWYILAALRLQRASLFWEHRII